MRVLVFYCIIIALILKFLNSVLAKSCKELEKNVKHEFYPLRHCQRSNKTIIAYSDAENVEQCADFARLSRALAFNFSPKNRRNKNNFDVSTQSNNTKQQIDEAKEPIMYSCEVLACPEYRNFSTVINDTRFDYWSLYARPVRKHASLKSHLSIFLCTLNSLLS